MPNNPITAPPAWIENAARLIDEHCAITLIRDAGDVKEIAAIATIISAAAPTDTDITAALGECIATFPDVAREDWIEISAYYDSVTGVLIRVELGADEKEDEHQFDAPTLTEAMTAVRAWKEEQG